MEEIITIFGNIVEKFSTFSEEHSFILAGLMIVTLFLIAGKMIESKNPSKEETSTKDKNTTTISIKNDNEAPIVIGDGNNVVVNPTPPPPQPNQSAQASHGGIAVNLSGDGSKVEIHQLLPTPLDQLECLEKSYSNINIGNSTFVSLCSAIGIERCSNINIGNSSAFELKKELADNLFMGKMIFNTPQQMRSDEIKEATLRISKNEIIIDDLAKENQIIQENIKISPFMKAVLKSLDFDIMALNSEEQIIDDDTMTEWKWSIAPKNFKEEGQVYLTITVRVPLGHKEEYKDIPVFKRTIKILLNAESSLSKKFEEKGNTVYNIQIGKDGNVNIGNKNTITTTNTDLKTLLEAFHLEANKIADQLPNAKKEEFLKDVEMITTDVQAGKKSKFFDISKEGLIEAAQAVGGVGVTFMELILKIVEFLG